MTSEVAGWGVPWVGVALSVICCTPTQAATMIACMLCALPTFKGEVVFRADHK